MAETKKKIIAIGDTHGRRTWEKVLAQEDNTFDRVVFIGDYFDCWDPFTTAEQIENFNNILNYKRNNSDTVTVLLGNHDTQYIIKGERYSGYQPDGALDIAIAIENALSEGLVQLMHIEDDYMFTHAGLTQVWTDTYGLDLNKIEEEVNMLFENNRDAFRFSSSDSSGSGESCFQSPVWVRPLSLVANFAGDWTQVVGHTTQKNIQYYEGKEPIKLILIDAIDIGEYLVIEDGIPRTETVKP